MEGYMEGAMDRMLTKGQKIAIATIVTIIFVVIVVYISPDFLTIFTVCTVFIFIATIIGTLTESG